MLPLDTYLSQGQQRISTLSEVRQLSDETVGNVLLYQKGYFDSLGLAALAAERVLSCRDAS